MVDYNKLEVASAEPEASTLLQTFRAIGYSIEAAIADIVDNSISARAENIWIDYDWEGPSTKISILDDGDGMTNKELINAMRPGSKNPLTFRSKEDLGRFGLGLKTASFSQCQKFCVISKKEGNNAVWWSWDLDFIEKHKSWSIIKYCPNDKYLETVGSLLKGTLVLWWDIDRLTKDSHIDNQDSLDKFMVGMERVKKHLAMVFHRFISNGLNVFFRDRKIEAWDPFMIGTDGLQTKSSVYIDNRKIMIKGFVLPHRSKLTAEQYNVGKGPRDSWTAHQGFYVYRNNRLIVSGDWLGLFKREIHYDLCRIMIDLSNESDAEWQIDIKKSVARPPKRFKDSILAVAKDVRAQALQVYTHRGKLIKRKLSDLEDQFLWLEYKRHGKRFYKLNRNHPIISLLINSAESYRSDIEKMLRFIEETVPIPLITLKENENAFPHGQPFEGSSHDLIQKTMGLMYDNLIAQGKSDSDAKAIILNIEPFNFYPQYIECLNA